MTTTLHPGMRITRHLLARHGACEDQREIFTATFGKSGTTLTFHNLLTAATVDLNLRWFATQFLDEEDYRHFMPKFQDARDAYEKARNDANDAYYNTLEGTPRVPYDEYEDTKAHARNIYYNAIHKALRIFQVAQAVILWRIIR